MIKKTFKAFPSQTPVSSCPHQTPSPTLTEPPTKPPTIRPLTTPLPALLSLLLTTTHAVSFTDWSPPGPNDVRSPCPGLNSLANHNILPHSGKNLTIPMLTAALLAGMNVGADFSVAIGTGGLLSSPDPAGGSFDLDDLNRHNFPIEHDASLSREDFFVSGNDYGFNQTVFDTVVGFFGGKGATIATAAKAKFNRVVVERERDARFQYGAREFVLSYGETALYLSVMGDPITGIAPVDYVKIFFEQERLPYKEGWRPPTMQTTLATLGVMAGELNAANGEPVPEGLILGASTLKMAWMGLDPITGVQGGA